MKKKDGYSDGDALDYSPDFHALEEDHAIEAMKKENPKLYELMKKHGAEVDDVDAEPAKED